MRWLMHRMSATIPTLALVAATTLMLGCADATGPDEDDSGGSSEYTLTVSNETGSSLTTVNVSPCSSDTWGANQLSSDVSPGSERDIDGIPGGCYDLRAITSAGGVATSWEVDITRDRRWIVR